MPQHCNIFLYGVGTSNLCCFWSWLALECYVASAHCWFFETMVLRRHCDCPLSLPSHGAMAPLSTFDFFCFYSFFFNFASFPSFSPVLFGSFKPQLSPFTHLSTLAHFKASNLSFSLSYLTHKTTRTHILKHSKFLKDKKI